MKYVTPYFAAPKDENAREPKFTIYRPDSYTEIHLCPACEDDLEDWLKNYGTVPSTPI